MSSIGGIGSGMMQSMYTQGTNRQDPGKMFNKIDTDGNGGISQAELDAVSDKVAQRTGHTPDVANAVASYDLDGDSMLSKTEMKDMMMERLQQMGPPLQMGGGVSPHQATLAYQANSGSSLTDSLFDIIDSYTSNLRVEESDNPLLNS